MKINYCPSCYTQELLSYYPFLYNVYIYVADDEFFDRIGLSDALAATDTKNIILVRDSLSPRLFRHALFHESEHISKPLATETEVEHEARKKDGFSYRINTYGLEFEVEMKSNRKSKLPSYIV